MPLPEKQRKKLEKGIQKRQEKRANQQAKKKRPRAQQRDTNRRRDWYDLVDDEDGYVPDERIMPYRGEEDIPTPAPSNGAKPYFDAKHTGRVVEVSQSLCRVHLDGEELLCRIRKSLLNESDTALAVGDLANVHADDYGDWVVEGIAPRRNVLARQDSFLAHQEQVLAANIDAVLIVMSWRNPQVWHEMIDRYLIMAERQGLEPVLCLNKIDLADNPADTAEFEAVYRERIGHVFLTSTVTEAGLDALREFLRGKTVVLSGLSGVGKSSLMTAIEPTFDLKVGEISEFHAEGKHTTTQARMLPFGESGFLIDTPGIRSFGLNGLQRDELIGYFPDLAHHASGCKFNDCSHTDEPDCAVIAAKQAGMLPSWRLNSFRKIYADLAEL